MLSVDSTVQGILNATSKEVSWLFEQEVSSTVYNWSTKNYTFDLTSYQNRIIPSSFSGIQLNSSLANYGVMAPNEISFDVSDPDGDFNGIDFVDEELTIKLVLKSGVTEAIVSTWKFYVVQSKVVNGVIKFTCKDFFSRYLKGTYPNTERVSSLAPSDDGLPNDNLCLPVVFGTGYIPLRNIYIADKRYYVLGYAGPTYAVSEVHTPLEWDSVSVWDNTYTYQQSTKSIGGVDYRVVEPIIVDSDNDGTADAMGLWFKNNSFLDAPFKFTKSDTVNLTSFENVIEYLLEDMGVPSVNIDTEDVTIVEDDCADDGTGDWSKSNVTLTFDTDHYEYSTNLASGSISITGIVEAGKLYRISCEFKDGTKTGGVLTYRYYKTSDFSDSVTSPTITTTGSFVNEEFYFTPLYSGSYTFRIFTAQPWYNANIEIKNFIIEQISSFTYCGDKTFTDWGLTCNGGIFAIEDKVKILSSILMQCNSVLRVTDKIELHTLSKTSVKTIDSSYIRSKGEGKDTTFTYRDAEKDYIDSCYISFPQANEPQSILKQVIVSVDGINYSNTSKEVRNIPFITDSQDAQRAGILSIQRKYDLEETGSCASRDDLLVLQPDDVITINDSKYGGTYNVVVQSVSISLNLTVNLQVNKYGHALDDWDDLSPDVITIYSDDSTTYFKTIVQGPDDATGGNIMTSRARIGSTILLDGENALISVGLISTPGATLINIDGANTKIESSNYVAGNMGAGFHLSPDLLEVGNIAARGIIRTAVFQKDVISAIGGSSIITNGGADVLASDMTALDASHVIIEGNYNWSVDDILVISEGTDEEWMVITNASGDPEYVVTRDLAGSYGVDDNPAWSKGATVVNYGQSGDGAILLSAHDVVSPYIKMFIHAGSPWSSVTELTRWGNLNGYADYVTDVYGWGAYIDEDNYLLIDPSNGIRMSGDIVIASLGDLAYLSAVDWATQVGGAGKPADNATVGATWGTNLGSIPADIFYTGSNDLDDIGDGSTYGKILLTDISAGHIVLASVVEDATYKLYTATEQTKLTGIAAGADVTSANQSATTASLSGHTLDGLANGTTYARVQAAVLDSGYLYLLRRSADQTERIEITASGVELYANNVKVIDIQNTPSITIGQVAASQNNILITSGALYLRNNTTNIISITSAGIPTIALPATGVISITGNDSTPAYMRLSGSSYGTDFYTNGSGALSYIGPTNNNVVDFSLGTLVNLFNDIWLLAVTSHIRGYYDADDYSEVITAGGNNTSSISLLVQRGGLAGQIDFVGSAFSPTTNKAISLGDATHAYDNIYADAYYVNGNVAGVSGGFVTEYLGTTWSVTVVNGIITEILET